MKLQEALKKSREEVRQQRNRVLEMQRKRDKKNKRENIILFTLIMIGFVSAIYLAAKIGQDNMKQCIKAGNSVEYCERGL